MAVKVKQHKGAWWVFIDHHGKRKAKRVGTSKRAAEQVAEKIQAKIALGQFEIKDEQQRRPFDSYFQNWLDTYARSHCKESTVAGYEASFRLYLTPAFCQKDISAITRDEVKRLAYTMLANNKSRAYVKGTLAPLSEMFNHAIEDGHTGYNPCLRIFRKSRKEKGESRKHIVPLIREEVQTLLAACQAHFPAHAPFVLLLARTGLRVGEAVALQWEDIDFHGRFIDVQRNWVDGHLTTPKSGEGRRVDMSRMLTDSLTTLLVERKKQTLKHGWGDVPAWVVTSESGTRMDPDNFRKRVWPKLLAKAGLRQIRMHDLQHTFASLLIQQGESLVYVKEQMGHHSIRVTVDTYGHLVPGGNKAAVDKLDVSVLNVSDATIRNPGATSVEAVELRNG